MNNYPSAVKTLRWLRKNRFRKKWRLFKQAYSVVMDLTSAIYIFFFLVLFLFGLKEYLSELLPMFSLFTVNPYTWVLTVFIALIIRAFISSFRSSGVVITSAEFQLTQLPYLKEKVWLYCLVEQMIKSTVRTFMLFVIAVILLPINITTLFLLFFAIWIASLVGIVLQWRVFQLRGWKKFIIVFGSILLLGVLRYVVFWNQLPTREILFISIALMILVSIYLFTVNPLRNVDWAKVVSFGDVKVWNMLAIQRITKVQIKPPTKFQLLNKMFRGKRAKRPLPYRLSAVSVRLWLPFFKDNLETILKTLGVFLLLVVVFGFRGKVALHIALALGIMAVNSVFGSLFTYHFQSPIVRVLPLRFAEWYQSYKKWYISFPIIYIIVSGLMLYYYDISIWIIAMNIVFYTIWLRIDLDLAVKTKVNLLTNNDWFNGPIYIARSIGAVVTFLTLLHPLFAVFGTIIALGFYFIKGPFVTDIEQVKRV